MSFYLRNNLDKTIETMLNELFQTKPGNVGIFMAEFLLTQNGTSLVQFKTLLANKLKDDKELYAAIIEDEKIKKRELEDMIAALEKKKISESKKIPISAKKSSSSVKNVSPQLDSDSDSEESSGDMRHYDFIPQDIINLYKRRNRNLKKIKKEKEENMSVVIFPTLSTPFIG